MKKKIYILLSLAVFFLLLSFASHLFSARITEERLKFEAAEVAKGVISINYAWDLPQMLSAFDKVCLFCSLLFILIILFIFLKSYRKNGHFKIFTTIAGTILILGIIILPLICLYLLWFGFFR